MKDYIKNKVVVITGASSGIGEASAQLLSQKGAKLVLGARRQDRLKQITKALGNREVSYKKTDVTDPQSVKELIGLAQKKYGRVDVLFNNAGIFPNSNLNTLNVNRWSQMVDVNIKGVLYGIAAVLPIMENQKAGQIITTDSVSGHVVSPDTTVYAGSKFAIQAIMEGLRQEEVKNQIKATMISPGVVDTKTYRTVNQEKTFSKVKSTPGQKLRLQAPDIARAVAYAINQPVNVAVNEVLIRPTTQKA